MALVSVGSFEKESKQTNGLADAEALDQRRLGSARIQTVRAVRKSNGPALTDVV